MSRYNLKKTPHDEGANREKAPQGFYTFQITDYKEKDKEGSFLETKNGDPKIMAICEIVESQEDDGKSALLHVVFYRPDSKGVKGIGMTRHFLKCIEQIWEGELDADPDDWIGKRFKAEVVHSDGYSNIVDIQGADQVEHFSSTNPDPSQKTEKPKTEEEIEWDADK